MKKILYIVFIIAITAILYGYYSKGDIAIALTHKIIGVGITLMFLVWMPLFIYHRYKGKDVKQYMINDDFFKKINDEAESFIDKKQKK